MKYKFQTILKTVYPAIEKLGYSYLKDIAVGAPLVFAKKSKDDLFFILLIGREISDKDFFSIEISLSPSLNAGLTGRDIPSCSIRPLGVKFWTLEMLSINSSLTDCITHAESEMLLDEAMIKELKRSKKLLYEVQLEKWVISCYHEKEESQLPLLDFIQYTPKESVGCIDLKWFIVAEVVLMMTWLRLDRDRVSLLATQAYWKDYLESISNL